MFGNNPVRSSEAHLSGSTLRIQEIFYTLQGEGPLSGMPCTFIRLAGCNLRCHFCFVGTTSVRMADGTSKPISEVRVGDLVISYASGEWVPKEVTKVMKSEAETLVRVTHGSAKTFATPDHPFYVRDRGWVPAAELEAGDQLVHLSSSAQKRLWNPMKDPEFCFNGDEVREVKVIDRGGKAWTRLAGDASAPTAAVYNLEVADTHNYVANGVVVHNCDTQFDSNWDNVLTIPHILKAMDFETGYKPKAHELVVITGGEPMLQNLQPLIQALLLAGTKLVQIESAGTLWQEDLKDYIDQGKVLLVCSPKTPKIHPDFARHCNHYKYVVKHNECSAVDGLPTFSTQKVGSITQLYRPAGTRGTTIWISPCDEHDPEKNLLNMIYARDLCLEHGHRLSLQTHKIVNVR